jgi:hypothetical protein
VADEGRRRVGGRAAGVVLVVAAVAASGVFLDRSVGPKSASAGTEPGAYSGAWFCPHGGGDGWKGWVAVTNPGPAPVGVRVTTFGKKGPAAGGSFSLPARTERLVEVPATDPADTAEVEYFGGWVGAGAILDTGGTTPRTTAERCAPASHRTWFLPDGTTTTGQAAWLVVMNPFAKDAEFSVTIRTEKRSVQPGPLTPSVLGAGRSVAIKLNDFALAGPGEKTITAEVVGKIGRVVAGSLEVGTDGVRSDAGIPAASKQWFLPVAGYPGPATLSIQDPGSRRVDLSVVDEGQDELKLASGVSGISVPAGGVLTYSAGVLPGAGVSVQAMNGVPFVLSGRVGGRNGDVATVAPVASSARRWVVPVTCPASGGQAILILLDTGRARVEVRVTAIGPDGPIPSQALASITVLPGRVVQVPLPAGPNGAPASALVESTGDPVVAGGACDAAGGSGHSATAGIPVTGKL